MPSGLLSTRCFRTANCFHKRYCRQIADMTRTRSGDSSASKERGQTFRQYEIAKTDLLSPYLYRARNLIERLFDKIKQCRRVATRHYKLAANYLAFIKARINPNLAAR